MSETSEELRSVRFKPEPGVAPHHRGGFPWKRGTFVEFLLSIPYFETRFRVGQGIASDQPTPLPALDDLNELLMSGRVDAGMSGGCSWKPFEIGQSEFEILSEYLLTDPRFTFASADDVATDP